MKYDNLEVSHAFMMAINDMFGLPQENWIGAGLNGELPYGWAGELTYPNTIGFGDHFQLYRDMVEWINTNIKDPGTNVQWTKIGDCIYVQFRKQKDMTWFALRFGVCP